MGDKQRFAGVRPASESTIEIDFRYRNIRCRERLNLEPSARNLAVAARRRAQVMAEIDQGTFDYAQAFPDSPRARQFAPSPSSGTIAEGLRAWYREKEQELEHSSLLTYHRIIENVLIPRLGDRLVSGMNRAMVKELLASLGPGLSGKRLGNILCPLRGVADEAVRDEVLRHSPMDGFKVKRRRRVVEDHEDIDPFSPAEVQAILQALADEPQLRNLCQFDFACGLRTGELIGLRWGDVDLVQGTVAVRRSFVMGKMKSTKTSAGHRLVSLIPAARDALRAQQAHTRLAAGAVFQNPRTGEAWDGDRQIREHYWRRALASAGVRYRYPYQMRHTYASQALSAGENVMWVAAQLGHKDWSVTARRYARWIPSALPEAGDKLAALWATAGAPRSA